MMMTVLEPFAMNML